MEDQGNSRSDDAGGDSLLTIREVAARLHVHPQTVRNIIYRPGSKLRYQRVASRLLRFTPEAVEAYLRDTEESSLQKAS